MNLSSLTPGMTGKISFIDPESPLFYRFTDMGLIPKAPISCLFKSFSGQIKGYSVWGSIIAIRNEDARYINVIF